MGLFGSKDEIPIKLAKGQIKTICAKSFMGSHLECDSDYYGQGSDSVVFAQRYFATPQMCRALGNMNACAKCTVTRYGSFTVDLFPWDFVAEEKQRAFPQIAQTLEDKGYGAFYQMKDANNSSCYLTITKDGSNRDTWKEDLTKMLNDIALYALRVLERY